MLLDPECTLNVLQAFASQLPLSSTRRKSVKALSVLNSEALSSYSDEDKERAYRYLLDKKMLELQYPQKAPAMRGFPAVSVPSKSQYRAAETKHHRVLAVTTAGYTLLDFAEKTEVKSKINVQTIFENICTGISAGKDFLELLAILGIRR